MLRAPRPPPPRRLAVRRPWRRSKIWNTPAMHPILCSNSVASWGSVRSIFAGILAEQKREAPTQGITTTTSDLDKKTMGMPELQELWNTRRELRRSRSLLFLSFCCALYLRGRCCWVDRVLEECCSWCYYVCEERGGREERPCGGGSLWAWACDACQCQASIHRSMVSFRPSDSAYIRLDARFCLHLRRQFEH